MGYCSYCGSWVDEGGICDHCGTALTYEDPDDEAEETDNQISRYEYFYRQGKACSIKEEHSTAIKFYDEAYRQTINEGEKWNALSSIAGEYEAMIDYRSAERYWNKCRELEPYCGYMSVVRYIAERGDFSYRRGRYEEAIGIYEDALEGLRALKEREIGMDMLKIGARTVHRIIDSYDRLGKDNQKEKYHNELKHWTDRYIPTGRHLGKEATADYLCEAAWKLHRDDRVSDEALILIDSAIELHPDCPAEYYNTKAIMLDETFQYDDALKWYDIALSKDRGNPTISKNRAECINAKLKDRLLFERIMPHDLELINDALKTIPDDCDNGKYLSTKAEILYQLGEPVKAKVCSALSVKNYAEVEKAERQLKRLKTSETYINITGVHNYHDFEPFIEGTLVILIREPDNPHDRDAIRVEISGETVGYVANNKYTLINEVKSATDIKNINLTQAEVQFILFDEWVIAKLI